MASAVPENVCVGTDLVGEPGRPVTSRSRKRGRTKKPPSAQAAIQLMVLANPSIAVDDILERMERCGYHPTRFFVATTRSNFRNALKLIKDERVDVRKLEI